VTSSIDRVDITKRTVEFYRTDLFSFYKLERVLLAMATGSYDHKSSSQFEGNCHGKNNDDSNPQQGTGGFRPSQTSKDAMKRNDFPSNDTVTRNSHKIPPTTRDARKLFVGGLPPDSTYYYNHGAVEFY
jgi:hypothetical protein